MSTEPLGASQSHPEPFAMLRVNSAKCERVNVCAPMPIRKACWLANGMSTELLGLTERPRFGEPRQMLSPARKSLP